jgi:hypothetical protein
MDLVLLVLFVAWVWWSLVDLGGGRGLMARRRAA